MQSPLERDFRGHDHSVVLVIPSALEIRRARMQRLARIGAGSTLASLIALVGIATWPAAELADAEELAAEPSLIRHDLSRGLTERIDHSHRHAGISAGPESRSLRLRLEERINTPLD